MIPPKVFSKWLDLRAQVRRTGEAYRAQYPDPSVNSGKGSLEYSALSDAEHELTVYENERCGGYPIPSEEQRKYMEQMEATPSQPRFI
jgi:hypothetical protein